MKKEKKGSAIEWFRFPGLDCFRWGLFSQGVPRKSEIQNLRCRNLSNVSLTPDHNGSDLNFSSVYGEPNDLTDPGWSGLPYRESGAAPQHKTAK
jgi:hypothetical protein